MENTKYDSGNDMFPADYSDQDFHHVKLISAADIKEIISMKQAVSLMGSSVLMPRLRLTRNSLLLSSVSGAQRFNRSGEVP